jgi:hypothetical protein
MKNSAALLALVALTLVMSGCGSPSGGASATGESISTGPNGEMLLVNPNSARENSEMEAGFEGALVLNNENCIIGRGIDGQEMALVFPADTRFAKGDPLAVTVEGHRIEVGVPMHVTLGGGVLSGGQLGELLERAPEQCRREETFYVQTVSSHKP